MTPTPRLDATRSARIARAFPFTVVDATTLRLASPKRFRKRAAAFAYACKLTTVGYASVRVRKEIS